jgi:hypothetical protein
VVIATIQKTTLVERISHKRLFLIFTTYTSTERKKRLAQDGDYILQPISNGRLDCSALVNSDSLLGLSAGCSKFLNVLDNIHSLDNLAKDDMFSIEPASDDLSLVFHSDSGLQW